VDDETVVELAGLFEVGEHDVQVLFEVLVADGVELIVLDLEIVNVEDLLDVVEVLHIVFESCIEVVQHHEFADLGV